MDLESNPEAKLMEKTTWCPKCECEVNVIHKMSGDICERCRTVLVDTSPWKKFFVNQDPGDENTHD